jgi:hypothetical protein
VGATFKLALKVPTLSLDGSLFGFGNTPFRVQFPLVAVLARGDEHDMRPRAGARGRERPTSPRLPYRASSRLYRIMQRSYHRLSVSCVIEYGVTRL